MKKSNTIRESMPILLTAAMVAILLLSAWPSVWATPAQDPLRQTVPTPAPGQGVGTFTSEEGGTLASPLGDVTVTCAPGCLAETINLVYSARTVGEAPPAAAGFRLLGHVFTLEAFRDLESVPGYVFASPLQICVLYTADDVTSAGGDPHNMVLQYYDEGTEGWVDLATTIDPDAGTACAEITHLTWFALAVAVPVELPITGTELAIDLRLVIVALAGMLLSLSAGLYVRRAR